MLFHLTTEDDIRVIHEQGPAETDAGGSTFASEQAFNNLAREWPMKRLIEIWNRLPEVQALARFTDRQTAIARIRRTAAFVLAFALSLAAQTVQSTLVPATVTTTVQPDNPGCKITIFNGTDKTIVGWGLDVSVTHTDGKSYGPFRLVHDNNFAYAYPFDPEETKALRDNLLLPGTSQTEQYSDPEAVSCTAKVNAVVYEDRTSDGDQRTIGMIFTSRQNDAKQVADAAAVVQTYPTTPAQAKAAIQK